MPGGQLQWNFWRLVLFAGAVVINGLAALKLTIGSPTQWAASLVLIFGYALFSQVRLSSVIVGWQWRAPCQRFHFLTLLFPWLLLCLGVAIAAALNDWQGIEALPKFVALLVVLVFFIQVRPTERIVLRALQSLAVLAISVLLILLWGRVYSWLVLVPDRYGWIWSPPGVLWKAGIYLLPLLSWWVINARHSFMSRWSWLVVCGGLVGLDGSRTASLLVVVIWVFVISLGLARHGFKRVIIRRASALAVVMMVSIGGINPSNINPVSHIYSEFDALLHSGEGSLDEGSADDDALKGRDIGEDSIRYAMVMDGLRGVVDHFPAGGGLGASVTQTESMTRPMVVHMAYLQLLADVGIIGFVGYLGIFLVPVAYAISRLRQSADPWACFDRMVLPLGILGIYLFGGLLHPVSTELSEWLIVLVGIAMLSPDDLDLASEDHQ